jgi:hypothetical protein
LCWRIQKRLVAIQCNLPHRKRHFRSPPARDITTNQCFLTTQHIFSRVRSGYRCEICGVSASKGSLKDCASTPCSLQDCSVFSQELRPFPATVRLSGQVVHDSHKIAVLKGVFACTKCGCYSTRTIKKLAHPCVPLPKPKPKAAYGTRVCFGPRPLAPRARGLAPGPALGS